MLSLLLAAAWVLGPTPAARAAVPTKPTAKTGEAKRSQAKPTYRAARLDHSGKRQRGKASYYSRKFSGRKMADGTPMNPSANVAASKTLPLGTKAKVKNLETGKSTTVEIRDRGPYVKDRIIDLSPAAARQLDMGKEGVAPVEVAPVEGPPWRGGDEPGAATAARPGAP